MSSKEKSISKPTPLQPLPTVDQPDQLIHIDLFGPLRTLSEGKKRLLVMKTPLPNMQRPLQFRTSKQRQWRWKFIVHWICQFGSPAQIHSDNGTEFINNLNKKLFKLLDIKHTTTTLGHPQCNAQAEVYNKTMAKYLPSFVDSSTLDWEQYLPALQFFYNTSYHSMIATTPYELLYGMKPRMPSIPGQDIQRKFYGKKKFKSYKKQDR
jgi:hypothetical protein